MPSRPWSKVGADLFELGQQNFLILVDYWSSYFEVQELKRITSTTVITACKVQFARHLNTNLNTRLQVRTFPSQTERHGTPLKSVKESPSRQVRTIPSQTERPRTPLESVKESPSRQQRSTASFLGLEKHAHRGSRNLACPASYG